VAEFDYNQIPLLEGFYSTTAARKLLGLSKQGMQQSIRRGNWAYSDLRRFDEEGRERVLLVRAAVDEVVARKRAEAAESKATAKVTAKERARTAELKAVRRWARARGIRVRNDRPIASTLVRQYRAWLREQEPPAAS
jgi:hypothetical protein